jgi:hypothetical protein
MKAEDALRKIGLLRKVKTENGALAAEAENAARLARALMERYAIKAEDIPSPSRRSAFRLSWIYWHELFKEFGLKLRHFGGRGSVEVGGDKIVYIKLGANQWWIEQLTGGGWQMIARDWGVESLRQYLREHARGHSLFRP